MSVLRRELTDNLLRMGGVVRRKGNSKKSEDILSLNNAEI